VQQVLDSLEAGHIVNEFLNAEPGLVDYVFVWTPDADGNAWPSVVDARGLPSLDRDPELVTVQRFRSHKMGIDAG